MKTVLKKSAVLTLSALIVACGSTPEESAQTLNENIPDWVTNPKVENGLASSACVVSSGHASVDKAQATALARVELAQEVDTRVKALDQSFQQSVESGEQAQTGSSFTSVSKQLTQQSLGASRVTKSAYANFDGKKQMCVLTTLSKSSTEELFTNIVKQSDRSLSDDQEKQLLLEFKGQKAQEHEDDVTESLTK